MSATPRTIEPAQQSAARAAGALYLVAMAIALSSELAIRSRLIVRGDPAQTARNILASERLFRLGTVSQLIMVACNVALIVALYVVLSRVGKNLALLGSFWRLIQCAMLAFIGLIDFATLLAVNGPSPTVARTLITLRHNGGQIGIVFLGLGSAAFAWLWLQSRYIPRWLAAWGIFASVVVSVITPMLMLFPEWPSIVAVVYWIPTFFFEVILGFWLLIAGLKENS